MDRCFDLRNSVCLETNSAYPDLHYLAINRSCVSVLESALLYQNPNKQNAEGETPLVTACKAGNDLAVQVLLNDSRTTLNIYDRKHNSAFYYAVNPKFSGENTYLVNLLLGDPRSDKCYLNDLGKQTTLHWIARTGSHRYLNAIKDRNIAPLLKKQDILGNTPMHATMNNCATVVMDYFLSTGEAGLRIKENSFGHTPLHLACEKNCRTAISKLVNSDRNLLFIRNKEGQTPLELLPRDRCLWILDYFPGLDDGLCNQIAEVFGIHQSRTEDLSRCHPAGLMAAFFSKKYQKEILQSVDTVLSFNEADMENPIQLAAYIAPCLEKILREDLQVYLKSLSAGALSSLTPYFSLKARNDIQAFVVTKLQNYYEDLLISCPYPIDPISAIKKLERHLEESHELYEGMNVREHFQVLLKELSLLSSEMECVYSLIPFVCEGRVEAEQKKLALLVKEMRNGIKELMNKHNELPLSENEESDSFRDVFACLAEINTSCDFRDPMYKKIYDLGLYTEKDLAVIGIDIQVLSLIGDIIINSKEEEPLKISGKNRLSRSLESVYDNLLGIESDEAIQFIDQLQLYINKLNKSKEDFELEDFRKLAFLIRDVFQLFLKLYLNQEGFICIEGSLANFIQENPDDDVFHLDSSK